MKVFTNVVFGITVAVSSLAAHAGETWYPGKYAGSEQFLTCTANAGTETGPYYTASGVGEEAAQAAYEQALTFVNIANLNPMYLEVTCN